MPQLVVCCDGTWQDSAANSNVFRLNQAFVPKAGGLAAHYVRGVGTTWSGPANVRAGLTGAGLDESITDGYRWLVENFKPDYRISLFGFSRGALLGADRAAPGQA
jgi:uncharacterized protein (DUF2235 family)